jgi:hypothetical protein
LLLLVLPLATAAGCGAAGVALDVVDVVVIVFVRKMEHVASKLSGLDGSFWNRHFLITSSLLLIFAGYWLALIPACLILFSLQDTRGFGQCLFVVVAAKNVLFMSQSCEQSASSQKQCFDRFSVHYFINSPILSIQSNPTRASFSIP